jgi:DNA-binding IclR family transcriptional regulator
MVENPIDSDVRQFILTNIYSIAQFEGLLLLHANSAEKWGVTAVAKRLYISEEETSKLLASLCELGMVITSGDDPLQYAYQPASGDLARMADRLAEVYAKHLVPVTNLIHSNHALK